MKLPTNLIEKYNVPVPRYTSYPPANFFHSDFNQNDYINFIKDSNENQPELISIYIHIPFCSKICHFCGCHAYRPTREEQVDVYLEALKKEINLVSNHLDKSRKVSQIHYGGGTPNSIDAKYLKELNEIIFNNFEFIEKPEIAIECNPAHLDEQYIDDLIEAGFNRFSIGIQDFDTDILKTINRDPSKLPVIDLVKYIRRQKPDASINLDFIYGLPGQSIDSFNESIRQAIAIKPERLVTFSYAHVPWVKKHQNILERKGLPSSDDKINMFLSSRKLLIDAGYIPIGLDHYVLPIDELNVAYRTKTLHRNFQGYCTRQTTGQVYAFGVSAISQLENTYIQNTKDTKQYIELINEGILPSEKGYHLSPEQKIIREVITRLMCNNYLNFEAIASEFNVGIDVIKHITNFSEEKFNTFIKDDLMSITEHEIKITEKGSFFIRNIAASFDPNYELISGTYSKSI